MSEVKSVSTIRPSVRGITKATYGVQWPDWASVWAPCHMFDHKMEAGSDWASSHTRQLAGVRRGPRWGEGWWGRTDNFSWCQHTPARWCNAMQVPAGQGSRQIKAPSISEVTTLVWTYLSGVRTAWVSIYNWLSSFINIDKVGAGRLIEIWRYFMFRELTLNICLY